MGRTAFLVDRMEEAARVSPFFAKARWLVVHENSGDLLTWRRVRANGGGDLVLSILCCAPDYLVCGWIDDVALAELLKAGVSVRLAPCTAAAFDLAGTVEDLPPARFRTRPHAS